MATLVVVRKRARRWRPARQASSQDTEHIFLYHAVDGTELT